MKNIAIAEEQKEIPRSAEYSPRPFPASKAAINARNPVQFSMEKASVSFRDQETLSLTSIDRSTSLKIQCIDETGVELYSTEFIRMARIRRQHNQILELRKTLSRMPVRISLILDQQTGKLHLRVAYTGNSRDV